VFAEVVAAIRRQVECLPEAARVEIAVADETGTERNREADVPPGGNAADLECQTPMPELGTRGAFQIFKFVSTRDPTPGAVTPVRRPRELTVRGVALSAEFTTTIVVRLARNDEAPRGANATASRAASPDDANLARTAFFENQSPRVFFFENGVSVFADAALARGALDWLGASSSISSAWETANVPRVSRRERRYRVDADGVSSLALETEPAATERSADATASPRAGALMVGRAERSIARPPAVEEDSDGFFQKHAYRVAELVVHVARNDAFFARTEGDSNRGGGRRDGGEAFCFHPSLFVLEENAARDRPGEAARARARLVHQALGDAIWRAKRLDNVTFASASERTAASIASSVFESAASVLRRSAMSVVDARLTRAIEAVAGANWEAEYRIEMRATAFSDARYDA
jgi:hypothetical protein